MKLTARERQQINTVVQCLKKEFGATEVILYGSASRGDMTAESDIDLLAVLPAVDWEIEKRIADVCFKTELQMNRIVSVLSIAEEDYRHSPMRSAPIVLNAQREGVA